MVTDPADNHCQRLRRLVCPLFVFYYHPVKSVCLLTHVEVLMLDSLPSSQLQDRVTTCTVRRIFNKSMEKVFDRYTSSHDFNLSQFFFPPSQRDGETMGSSDRQRKRFPPSEAERKEETWAPWADRDVLAT